MTQWIENTNTRQDGSPVTRSIKIPEMSEEIFFTTNAYAEVSDSVADLLSGNIDEIIEVSEPSSPGTYYEDAGGQTSVTVVLNDETFNDITVSGKTTTGSLYTDQVNTEKQAIDASITTTEIQEKLNSYPETGGPVKFGPDQYSDLGQIQLEHRHKLVGSGIGATRLKAESGLDDNFIQYVNDDGSDYYFGEIRNIHINQNRDNNTGGHGIYTNDPSGAPANDLYVENIFVTADENGFHADFAWGYRLQNSIFEFCNGQGLVFLDGTQCYLTDLFLQQNGSDGGTIRANQCKIKGLHANDNAGNGLILDGERNSITNSYFGINDFNGLVTGEQSGATAHTITGVVAANNGQDTNVSSPNRCGVKINTAGTVISDVWAYDSQSTPTQDRGVYLNATDIVASNIHAKGNDTYGIITNSNRVYFSNIVGVDNASRGLNIGGSNCVVNGAYLSGNGGTDLVVAGTDNSLWNVNAGSISDSGTRTRWNGIIKGGPLGGTDIGSLTGASTGDKAMADGTTATNADTLWILKSSGDWQRVDGGATITPA